MQRVNLEIAIPRGNKEEVLTNPPHENISVLVKGNIEDPKKAMILMHGRFASAENIMSITDELSLTNDIVIFAPQAKTGEWYPHRFLVPRKENQPFLNIALLSIEEIIRYAFDNFQIKPDQIILAGFSQGACLVADYAARKPQRYGGICIFSGGLIGTDTEIEQYNWQGNLEKTPTYIGCDKNDFHIPLERVSSTTSVFEKLNANVTEKIYNDLGHSIHEEGLQFLNKLIQ